MIDNDDHKKEALPRVSSQWCKVAGNKLLAFNDTCHQLHEETNRDKRITYQQDSICSSHRLFRCAARRTKQQCQASLLVSSDFQEYQLRGSERSVLYAKDGTPRELAEEGCHIHDMLKNGKNRKKLEKLDSALYHTCVKELPMVAGHKGKDLAPPDDYDTDVEIVNELDSPLKKVLAAFQGACSKVSEKKRGKLAEQVIAKLRSKEFLSQCPEGVEPKGDPVGEKVVPKGKAASKQSKLNLKDQGGAGGPLQSVKIRNNQTGSLDNLPVKEASPTVQKKKSGTVVKEQDRLLEKRLASDALSPVSSAHGQRQGSLSTRKIDEKPIVQSSVKKRDNKASNKKYERDKKRGVANETGCETRLRSGKQTITKSATPLEISAFKSQFQTTLKKTMGNGVPTVHVDLSSEKISVAKYQKKDQEKASPPMVKIKSGGKAVQEEEKVPLAKTPLKQQVSQSLLVDAKSRTASDQSCSKSNPGQLQMIAGSPSSRENPEAIVAGEPMGDCTVKELLDAIYKLKRLDIPGFLLVRTLLGLKGLPNQNLKKEELVSSLKALEHQLFDSLIESLQYSGTKRGKELIKAVSVECRLDQSHNAGGFLELQPLGKLKTFNLWSPSEQLLAFIDTDYEDDFISAAKKVLPKGTPSASIEVFLCALAKQCGLAITDISNEEERLNVLVALKFRHEWLQQKLPEYKFNFGKDFGACTVKHAKEVDESKVSPVSPKGGVKSNSEVPVNISSSKKLKLALSKVKTSSAGLSRQKKSGSQVTSLLKQTEPLKGLPESSTIGKTRSATTVGAPLANRLRSHVKSKDKKSNE